MAVEDWSEADGRKWCNDHDGILFEAATGEADAEDELDEAASDTATSALETAERSLRLARARFALQELSISKMKE